MELSTLTIEKLEKSLKKLKKSNQKFGSDDGRNAKIRAFENEIKKRGSDV